MKNVGIGFLILAAILLEIHLVIILLLPYMDYQGIGLVYFVSFMCRVAIYLGIVVGYDYLWDKYLTHNTMAYRNGLIDLYKKQIYCEKNAYMVTVLNKAILKLKSGDNPTSVEEYVVRQEKHWRKGI